MSHELVRTALTTEFQRVEIPFTDIPPYAKKLRVKVEMIGRGEVWIDDLRVNDTAFSAKERNQLEKILQIAFYQYETNDLLHCHESLSGYWPRFLMRYIGPIEVAQNDSSSRPPAKPQQPKRSS